jgi:hypothetical protein
MKSSTDESSEFADPKFSEKKRRETFPLAHLHGADLKNDSRL